MYFVVIGKDRDDGTLRREARADHLTFVAGSQDRIVYAGPLIEQGQMVGSLFIFDVEDRRALDACLAQDPYFACAIFGSIEIYESRWMVPEKEPGFLLAEAERARS